MPDAIISPQGSGESMIEFDYNVSEVAISYRPKVKPSQRPKITCSGDVVPHLRKVWEDLDYRESMYLVLMNRANKILGISKISTGGVSSTVFGWRHYRGFSFYGANHE